MFEKGISAGAFYEAKAGKSTSISSSDVLPINLRTFQFDAQSK